MAKKKVVPVTKPIDDLVGSAINAQKFASAATPTPGDSESQRFAKKWSAGKARSFREQFAEKLKALREKAGLSVRALAERSGVDHSQLLRLESAERSCTLETAVQIAGALGVSLGILTDEAASSARS